MDSANSNFNCLATLAKSKTQMATPQPSCRPLELHFVLMFRAHSPPVLQATVGPRCSSSASLANP